MDQIPMYGELQIEAVKTVERLKGITFNNIHDAAQRVQNHGGILYGILHTEDSADNIRYDQAIMIPGNEAENIIYNWMIISRQCGLELEIPWYFRVWIKFIVVDRTQPLINKIRAYLWW